jgi:hypothetical protein
MLLVLSDSMAPTDELIANVLSEVMSGGRRDIFFLNVRMISQYYLPEKKQNPQRSSRDTTKSTSTS